MKFEVVVTILKDGQPVDEKFPFEGDTPPETQDDESLLIENDDGDAVAVFRNWNYWRKID